MYDIRAVVGIDFGTTYSGFAYSNTAIPEIETNEEWPPDGTIGKFKTNTVLMYDENGDKVKLWGNKALVNKKARGSKDIGPIRPIELFKLHLGRDIETSENLESRLNEVSTQNRINYKKAVADYLSEMAEATAIYCRKVLDEHFEVPFGTVVKGAVEYGLNMKCVKNRVLKNTYGVMLTVTRGTKVDVDEEFSVISTPLHPSSKTMSIEIFETLSRAPKFFDEPRMRQLEKIKVDLSENPNSNGASSSKIKAMAKVKGTGEIRQALINLGL
nr:3445_t:CDS:2 [Entrophospora candida]